MAELHTLRFTLNGVEQTQRVEPWTSLLDLLREQLGLTGTKKGCDHGQCGACTVLVDGKRINSCLTLAVMKEGASVTTIEGLSGAEALHPLQAAFIEKDAFQCGYCTPGQICSAVGMISEGHAKTLADVRELMSGNLCRCGAYPNIVEAIVQVMNRTDESGVKERGIKKSEARAIGAVASGSTEERFEGLPKSAPRSPGGSVAQSESRP